MTTPTHKALEAPSMAHQLNFDQTAALDKILAWLADPYGEPFFVLKGYAGTGKTFTVKELVKQFKGRIVFTAPTNKATKVLRATLKTPQYSPECRTIYSLLGLKLEANGGLKELKSSDDPIDLSQFRLVVVDEGSMLNKHVVAEIKKALDTFKGLRVLFMGDAAQLPPVGEVRSPIWDLPNVATLNKVMRHDNQILALATRIRNVVDSPAPSLTISNDNDERGGVWKTDKDAFQKAVRQAATEGKLTSGASKVIAWRNTTVDGYNNLARLAIFGNEALKSKWLPGDRLIFTEPVKDFNDDIVATTDDEGLVERVLVEYHPIHGTVKCFRITVQIDEGPLVVAYAVHPEGQAEYARMSEELAAIARSTPRKWKDFWLFKECFHSCRHAYAITAHRSQGSTYTTALVDYQDILVNRTRHEAFRCLYVACTRPTTSLVLA
jgi:exodeoxyribonuclease-5